MPDRDENIIRFNGVMYNYTEMPPAQSPFTPFHNPTNLAQYILNNPESATKLTKKGLESLGLDPKDFRLR